MPLVSYQLILAKKNLTQKMSRKYTVLREMWLILCSKVPLARLLWLKMLRVLPKIWVNKLLARVYSSTLQNRSLSKGERKRCHSVKLEFSVKMLWVKFYQMALKRQLYWKMNTWRITWTIKTLPRLLAWRIQFHTMLTVQVMKFVKLLIKKSPYQAPYNPISVV